MKLKEYFESQGRGSKTKLAKALGVSKSMVSHACAGKSISIARAKQIEKITKGKVSKAELRPDVWA